MEGKLDEAYVNCRGQSSRYGLAVWTIELDD